MAEDADASKGYKILLFVFERVKISVLWPTNRKLLA